MLCPVCKTDLKMAERQNIEIDYCPECRGVWLDRGELDKIIERSAAEAPEVVEARSYPRDRSYERGDADYNRNDYDERHGHGGKRRRKSFLGEMFDFGD